MAFFTDKCPECSESVSKDADYCSTCGCPGAQKWSNCQSCGTSVGADSAFCWKCGTGLEALTDRKFYGQRWNRSPLDFAIKVLLQNPEKTLESGLLVEDGTLAVLFQNGSYVQLLEPGLYQLKDLIKDKGSGLEKRQTIEAVLIDSKAAEVDFMMNDLHDKTSVAVDLRARVLFQVVEANRFVHNVLQDSAQFTLSDLSGRLEAAVQPIIAHWVADIEIKEAVVSWEERENLEKRMQQELVSVLDNYGLAVVGVRLAEFGGPVMDALKEKAGEIGRLNKELEVSRHLSDLSREEKVGAFRHEEELKIAFEQVSHEMGFKSAELENERRIFMQLSEHEFQKEGLQQDYELKKREILNRLDEQKMVHQSDLAELEHEIVKQQKKFGEELRQMKLRSERAQEQQKAQAVTDRVVASEGIESLKSLKKAKLEVKAEELAVERDHESARLEMLGDASMQALLATLDGEKADRLLKMAELEMRKGLSPESALALVAESSPEIAPSIAKLLKNKTQNS